MQADKLFTNATKGPLHGIPRMQPLANHSTQRGLLKSPALFTRLLAGPMRLPSQENAQLRRSQLRGAKNPRIVRASSEDAPSSQPAKSRGTDIVSKLQNFKGSGSPLQGVEGGHPETGSLPLRAAGCRRSFGLDMTRFDEPYYPV